MPLVAILRGVAPAGMRLRSRNGLSTTGLPLSRCR
jgi:hypothetical protein